MRTRAPARVLVLVAAIALGALRPLRAQTLYRCTDAGGTVVVTMAPTGGNCVEQKSTSPSSPGTSSAPASGRSSSADTRALPTALHRAASSGDINLAIKVIDRGVDIDARGSDGETALLSAVMSRQTAMVVYLLSRGAGPDLANARQETPLHHAAEQDSAEIVTALLRAGAAVSPEDIGGRTPLDWSTAHKESRTARLLTDEGGHAGHLPSSVDTRHRPVEYVSIYFQNDANGNVTRAETPNHVTYYDYDAVGQLTNVRTVRK
jgi:YD repeat-containing protein